MNKDSKDNTCDVTLTPGLLVCPVKYQDTESKCWDAAMDGCIISSIDGNPVSIASLHAQVTTAINKSAARVPIETMNETFNLGTHLLVYVGNLT